jgi:hypothetical protein
MLPFQRSLLLQSLGGEESVGLCIGRLQENYNLRIQLQLLRLIRGAKDMEPNLGHWEWLSGREPFSGLLYVFFDVGNKIKC